MIIIINIVNEDMPSLIKKKKNFKENIPILGLINKGDFCD